MDKWLGDYMALTIRESTMDSYQTMTSTTSNPTLGTRKSAPSPPQTSSNVRRRMQNTLERAQCKVVRFHDLRHTFATLALEHGMDVKTLSTIIGHAFSATTLDIYSDVTDTMQKQAAVKIDHQIGKTDAPMPPEEKKQHADQSDFQPTSPSTASAAPAACTRSTITSGRANTPQSTPTANEFPGMSMQKPKGNAKKNWQS